MWPGCVRTDVEVLTVHDDLDDMPYGTLVELAQSAGLLVLEEAPYPELLRARLKHSGA